MRFHKAEIAFFLFLGLLLAAGGMIFAAALDIAPMVEGGAKELANAKTMIYGASGLLLASTLFGGVFIFPLIRGQAREQGELRRMTEKLSARSVTLEHAALTDGLTGMQNRRYFDDALPEYLEEFGRIGKPVGLMILDLDHFKSVNDTHGHDVGDEVLKAVARCLKDFTRYHDVAARLGGEEFAVVAPNMDIDLLVKLADRIRRAVADLTVRSGNVTLKVTTSVGLAIWDRVENSESFYRRADRMLYEAKRQGRNRVCA